MTEYVCTQCNNPVKQPHCRLQMPSLKKGITLKANKFPCPVGLPDVKWEQERTPKSANKPQAVICSNEICNYCTKEICNYEWCLDNGHRYFRGRKLTACG